jgi:hypothetical protein
MSPKIMENWIWLAIGSRRQQGSSLFLAALAVVESLGARTRWPASSSSSPHCLPHNTRDFLQDLHISSTTSLQCWYILALFFGRLPLHLHHRRHSFQSNSPGLGTRIATGVLSTPDKVRTVCPAVASFTSEHCGVLQRSTVQYIVCIASLQALRMTSAISRRRLPRQTVQASPSGSHFSDT